MANTLLEHRLSLLEDKLRLFESETRKPSKFENYLHELLHVSSVDEFMEKYYGIQQKDEGFTLENINDKMINDIESLKLTMVFSIEQKIQLILHIV